MEDKPIQLLQSINEVLFKRINKQSKSLTLFNIHLKVNIMY